MKSIKSSKVVRTTYKYPSDPIHYKFKAHCSALGTNMQERMTKLILDDLRKHKRLRTRRSPKIGVKMEKIKPLKKEDAIKALEKLGRVGRGRER